MNRDPLVVVFTGIDGFLAETSQPSGRIIEAATRLAEHDVPLILFGSHTRAEIEEVQREIGNTHPFISENGAALHVPDGYFAELTDHIEQSDSYDLFEFAPPHSEVVLALHLIAARLTIEIVSFSDLSVEAIARCCDMSVNRAGFAKRRDYDEPFRLIHDGNAERMKLQFGLQHAGLRLVTGDGFHHVNGVRDPHLGLELLRSLYEKQYGSPVLTIGLGAELPDLNLLSHVDLPIIVRTSRHSSTAEALRGHVPHATVTRTADAEGWSHALCDVASRVQSIRQSLQ